MALTLVSPLLTALSRFASTGILVWTGSAIAGRTLTAPAAGFTITNPAGIAGDPTFVLANDLAGLEGLTGAGIIPLRTAADTWVGKDYPTTTVDNTIPRFDGTGGNLQTSDALVTNAGIVKSATGFGCATSINVADDAVANFGDVADGNLALVSIWRTADTGVSINPAVLRIRTNASPAISFQSIAGSTANIDLVTTNVTGTTGVDGRLTISATDGALKVENRSGALMGLSYFAIRGD